MFPEWKFTFFEDISFSATHWEKKKKKKYLVAGIYYE